MFSPLRNRFGIPGVISVIALVFAMLGGAYAANDSGSGDATASAKRKSKAGKRGPRGPRGKRGPAGPAGPQGLAGPAGPAGPKGDNGANGQNGADGKGAEVTSFTGSKTVGSVTCTEGGLEVKSASGTTLVCNGKKGANGQTGFTETLPSGKTETGTWGLFAPSEGIYPVPLSFNIPLAADLAAANVHYNAEGFEGTEGADCPGKASDPQAKPGHLCIYSIENTGLLYLDFGYPKVATGGAGVIFSLGATEPGVWASGTWAVTAP